MSTEPFEYEESRDARVTGDAARESGAAVTTSDASIFPIVGIGASAGGLESLERFFTHLPPTPGWRSSSCSTCRRTSRA